MFFYIISIYYKHQVLIYAVLNPKKDEIIIVFTYSFNNIVAYMKKKNVDQSAIIVISKHSSTNWCTYLYYIIQYYHTSIDYNSHIL